MNIIDAATQAIAEGKKIRRINGVPKERTPYFNEQFKDLEYILGEDWEVFSDEAPIALTKSDLIAAYGKSPTLGTLLKELKFDKADPVNP